MSNRGGARPGAGRKKGSLNRATAEARAAAAETGELPLQYMLRIMRDPNASNTRRDEMARTAAPYLHQKLVAAPFVPTPMISNDNRIEVVFVDPSGREVPFYEKPKLAATGPNAPKQLGVDGSPQGR